ncbi:NAD(P)-binding domain-containing protein [Chelativorans salis]|uniref:NAD(P)-binding domain-containing protein n=1 Tax=Chelativorans salis TaxID=2978478 RepID=A0ABT2LU56_9HYPH|nr:NAD(P)-binding domain-containing protein [Chelativorans sp. EGI FJ00035]MCT7378077.1 NAD(P)-binding domain-containing protein [Chelativorans sp. EGI FJ00035]
MARIGFLGTGEIASAMIQTIAGAGHDIVVSHRNERVSAELQMRHPGLRRAANQTVVDESDIVVLCLLADTARKELPNLVFGDGKTVISVMAGMPIAELERLCAPVTEICVAIPLPPMPLGGTPLAVYPENVCLHELFGPHVRIHACASEAMLNAHFAATGVLLPLLDQIDAAANWLSAFTDDRAEAASYLAGLIGAYCKLLTQETGTDLAQLRAGLGTEGGLNQYLSRTLADNGTLTALEAGLDGLRKRLQLPPKN